MFIRLITVLCASLYGSMVILGIEQPGATIADASKIDFEPVSSRSEFSPSISLLAFNAAIAKDAPQFDILAAIETANAESPVAETAKTFVLQDTVFVVGADERKPQGLIEINSADAPADRRVDTAGAKTLSVKPAVNATAGASMVEVTGNVVNLRSGPSTKTEVVTRLKRGVRAEVVADNGDGWLKIRDLNSGAEGFMSGIFLLPVTSG